MARSGRTGADGGSERAVEGASAPVAPDVRTFVIGDVVDSRGAPDPAGLLAGLAAAVGTLPARSAAPTTGDEFQAVFDDLPGAVVALAALRLALLDDAPGGRPVRLRIGMGVVPVVGALPDAGAPGQSHPGWWVAREALDHVAAPRRGWPDLAWWVDAGEDLDAAWTRDLPAVRATLVALDSLAARFDGIDVSLARGLLRGVSARRLAGDHDITPQSVTGRLHAHGVYGWVRTLEVLAATSPPLPPT